MQFYAYALIAIWIFFLGWFASDCNNPYGGFWKQFWQPALFMVAIAAFLLPFMGRALGWF